MHKSIRKNVNGITLIALVVTIVVLLILAGISLSLVLGENGIINKAKEAKDKTEQDQINTETALNELNDWIDEQLGDSTVEDKPDISLLQVGEYVHYTYPDAANYPLTEDKSGSSSNPKDGIPQTKELKWRILNIDEEKGTVELISAEPTDTAAYLYGANGYNNGVYLINDICAKQYSNTNLGVTARNLNIEDIEKKLNTQGIAAKKAYKSSDNVQYGHTNPIPYGSGYNNYPNLYASQIGNGINTPNVTQPNLDIADPYKESTYTEGIVFGSDTASSGLTVTQTYYNLGSNSTPSTYFDDKDFHSVIFGTGKSFWLASRYSNCISTNADFGLRCVSDDSYLYGYYMFNSNGNPDSSSGNYGLRPIVSINSSIIDIESGKDENDVWQIKTK